MWIRCYKYPTIYIFLSGCDLVGFHIEDYCVNFLDCCQRCLGCRADKTKMTVDHVGRRIQVGIACYICIEPL